MRLLWGSLQRNVQIVADTFERTLRKPSPGDRYVLTAPVLCTWVQEPEL